jgi:hypothetical protein
MENMKISAFFMPSLPQSVFPSGTASFIAKDDLFGRIQGQKRMVKLYSWEIKGKYFYMNRYKQ